MNNKKVIALVAVIAVIIIGTIAAIVFFTFDREGVAFNSGSFSATSGGRTFSIGVHSRSSDGIYNVANNTWRASPARANGSSRVNYTFTATNLDNMTVRNTNTEGMVSLTFTQGDAEKTVDITGDFNENIDMSSFEPGQITLRLVFENATNVEALISW